MSRALAQAELAAKLGEVPVGAVIAHQGQIIAEAHNEIETAKSATAHAEMLAIERASKTLGRWRLDDCTLCVTLEPCTMCIGATRLSRVGTLVFGASDSRLGAVGTLYDLAQDPRLGPLPRVIREVESAACGALLKTFFESLRH